MIWRLVAGSAAGVGEFGQGGLVGGEAAALVILAGDLALEFAHRPVAAQGFDFVEAALERVVAAPPVARNGCRKDGDERFRVWRGSGGRLCGQCPHFFFQQRAGCHLGR
jgi:hypothetical protein